MAALRSVLTVPFHARSASSPSLRPIARAGTAIVPRHMHHSEWARISSTFVLFAPLALHSAFPIFRLYETAAERGSRSDHAV